MQIPCTRCAPVPATPIVALCFAFLLDLIRGTVCMLLQDKLRPQAYWKGQCLPITIGQYLHAIRQRLDRQSRNEISSLDVPPNHQPDLALLVRYNGRKGAGGWKWRAGACARLEAGTVAASSASPRRPRQRWHSQQREDLQLWWQILKTQETFTYQWKLKTKSHATL